MNDLATLTLSRRAFIVTPAVACLLGASAGALTLTAPQPAQAADIKALIAEQFGPGPVQIERVRISPTPLVPETGAMVRFTVAVDHPMEPDNYIKSIAIFVENNPSPFAVRYNLTPKSGKAQVESVIKMVGNSPIHVVAASDKGKLYGLVQDVKLSTASTCAG